MGMILSPKSEETCREQYIAMKKQDIFFLMIFLGQGFLGMTSKLLLVSVGVIGCIVLHSL